MSNYQKLKVKEVVRETEDTLTIHFKQPLLRKIKYYAGQFITLILSFEGKEVRRAYSMSSTPGLDKTLAISVKRVKGGLVSNYLNDQIKAGDTLNVMRPAGNFTFIPDKNRRRHLILFGGGSGITPLISILKTALFFEPQSVVSLVYSNKNQENIIFRKQLADLQAKFPDRFQLLHNLSHPPENWTAYAGRLSPSRVAEILGTLPKHSPQDTHYYVCGPEGMMETVKNGLKNCDIAPEKIYTESFVTSTNATTQVAATKKTADEADDATWPVKIVLDGQTHELTVSDKQTILEAGLDSGIDMPFSCQSGLCTACIAKCSQGEVSMTNPDGISEDEKKQGYVLVCVAHPKTNDVQIEFE